MAGPYTDTIITNPAGGTLYAAAFFSNIFLNGGSATYETRSFAANGTQTVYGSLTAGVHDWTTGQNDLATLSGVFGIQHTSSLGNNNSDNLGPYGSVSVGLSGGAYISLRMVSSASSRPFNKLVVRRSGVWQNPEANGNAIWVRRSGVWVRKQSQGQEGFVRRSGAWTQLFFARMSVKESLFWALTHQTWRLDFLRGLAVRV